jgi:hypothetical protein
VRQKNKIFMFLFAAFVFAGSAKASGLWEEWEDLNSSLLGSTFFVNCYYEGNKLMNPNSFKVSKNIFGGKKLHELVEGKWVLVESQFQDTATKTKNIVNLTLDEVRRTHPELKKTNAFWSARSEFDAQCKGWRFLELGLSPSKSVFSWVDDSCNNKPLVNIFDVRGKSVTTKDLSFIKGTLTITRQPIKYDISVKEQCISAEDWSCEEDKTKILGNYAKYANIVAETGTLEKRTFFYECEKVR